MTPIAAPSGLDGLLVPAWCLAATVYSASLGWLVMNGVRSAWRRGLPILLAGFLSSSLGFALGGTLLFALASAGLFSGWGVGLGLAGLWLAAALLAWPRRYDQPSTCGFRGAESRTVLLLNISVLLALFLSLAWQSLRVPGMWDDTSYHLPAARHYLLAGGLEVQPWLRFPLFPQQANLLFAVALQWGSVVHVQAVASAIPLTLTAMGLVGVCQWQLRSSAMGWLAVGLLALQAPVRETMGYAYVDSWLMLFCWASTVGVLLSLRTPDAHARIGWIIAAGVLAGAAASTKLFGAIFAALIGVMLFALGPRDRRTWTYAAVTALFGLGWYLRSFVISGDPVHPAGGNLLGHYLWSAQDLASQHAEQKTHGGSRNPLALFASLQHAGIAMLLGGLLVVFRPRRWRAATVPLAALMLAYLLLWQALFPPARYTLPILPLGVFLIVLFIHGAGRGRLKRWLRFRRRFARTRVIFSVLATLVVCGALLARGHTAMTQQLAQWNPLLAQRTGYLVMQAANAHAASHGNRLVHLGYENAIYFFGGTAIGDWFGPGRYAQMMECAAKCSLVGPQAALALLDRFDARMLAVNAARFGFEPENYEAAFTVMRLGPNDYLLLRK